MVIMEKGHFGHYSGNARHSRTPVTKKNYKASVADDAAHIHYLKMDVEYDDHHGHSDEDMTADEKHISKLAGDMKYDKKHHSPFKQTIEDERSGDLPEVVVTGDASKVGAYGNQLDEAFETIQNTISSGGFGGSRAQSAAGLGYGTDPSKELARLRKMREEKGAPDTLKYMRRRSRSTVDGSGIPDYLRMPS